MTIYIHLSVKFRAFFITFGNVDKWFNLHADSVTRKLAVVEDAAHSGVKRTIYEGRGVLLEVVTGF